MPDLTGELVGKSLFRTFIIGIVLGIVAAAGVLYALPVVDQVRETSIMTVAPNGGTVESFHINIPLDRIMVGRQAAAEPVPPGLQWPSDPRFADVRTEMFKIRNGRDSVVGIAVRTAARRADEDVIDWLLHLPARGSLFVSLETAPRDDGMRVGSILSGTREFGGLHGTVGERWVANQSDEEDAPLGRIELRATYIGELEPSRAAEDVE